jgi:gp41|uniref:HeH/LEM domain n=1 Tax=Siphoviridae sp. ctJgf18 TaxID=2825435 RepID=A0A8S5UVT3_9CAUD|nr:MAG TPA: HeH/LEM domain [Siphoviridae sp. ctJgf18]
MEYINIKTGATIVTENVISGGDWVPIAAYKPLDSLTNAALKEILDEKGITYDNRATKSELISLIEQADSEAQ